MRKTLFSATLLAAVSLAGSAFSHATDDAQQAGTIILAAEDAHQHHGAGAAHDGMVKAGDLVIGTPYLRATLPNAPVSAGYMVIRNTGGEPDRLVGASAGFAGMVQIHEMTMDGDVMKMRELDGGLEIPAGGEVTLKPGGYHLMIMKLEEQLKEGETRQVTLQFEKAGTVTLELPVKKVKRGGHNHKHGHNHGHGHNHDS